MALEVNVLDPAHTVVRMLGGCRAVSRALNLSSSTVSRWCTAIDDGGTGGRIPQKHWVALINLATTSGIDLSIEQLSGLSKK